MAREFDVKKLATPADLQAVSSPQRVQIVDALYNLGHATVSQIAQATDLAIGSVSFHLRILARADIARRIEEPRSTDRRETWWEPAHKDGFDWDEDIWQSDWGAAGMRARWAAIQAVDWKSRRADPSELPDSWRSTHIRNDLSMRLTPDEVRQLSKDFLELMLKYRDLGDERAAAGDTADRRPYVIDFEGYPYRTRAGSPAAE